MYFIILPLVDYFIIIKHIESLDPKSIKFESSYSYFVYSSLPLLLFSEMAIANVFMQPMKLRFWWIILTVILFASLGIYRDLLVHDALRDGGYTSCRELLTGVKGGLLNSRYARSPEACLSATVPPAQPPAPDPKKDQP